MMCPDHQCLVRLRGHIAERLEVSDLLEGHPGMLALVCYGVATLATDPAALVCLTHQARQWALTEDYLQQTAENFAWEIGAVRQHLTSEEQGTGRPVPAWVLETFVQWPVGERSHG
jgi:hypothetical protein